MDKLKEQEDFLTYLEMLYTLRKQCIVMISSSDTPVGPDFTQEAEVGLFKLGLRINLENRFRESYAAIIDNGINIFEEIASDLREPVEYTCSIDETQISLCGSGFNVPKDHSPSIVINGINYSSGGRGLNFVVYDKAKQTVIDAVNFDTYAVTCTCSRSSSIVEGVFNYKKKHPEVALLSLALPGLPQKNLSVNEQTIINNAISRGMIMQQPDNPAFMVNKYIDSPNGVIEVLSTPPSYLNIDGNRRFEDRKGRYVNTVGGHRITTGQPKSSRRTIYLVGGCKIFGVGNSDKGTIASQLQRRLNENAPEQGIIVENYGYFLAELEGAQTNEEIKILNSLPVQSGDIVILDFAYHEEIPCLYVSNQRPSSYGEIFYDMQLHLTENGNRLVADRLFDKLKELDFLPPTVPSQTTAATTSTASVPPAATEDNHLGDKNRSELNEYKQILTDFYQSTFVPLIGAIVVNCNPFTLGHRYLIEEAASQCDHLMVFVVEEDQSFFTFDERMALIEKGVADFENITVIPSGRFIISSLTFSDYFNKSELQERTVDTSLDIELFAREIAPCLNIKIRFAGTEPFDTITQQYNETMSRMLPQYGIKFIEIPRKELRGMPISASRVRYLLKVKNFDEIAKLVPQTTLEYLMAKFG